MDGTSADFSSQISKAIGTNPDAIGVLFQGAPNLTIVKQLREGGFKGKIWGQQGMLNDFYMKGGPATDGTMISVSYSPALAVGATTKFTEELQGEVQGINPSELSAHGYDAVYFVANALKTAQSTDGAKLQKAMADQKSMEGAQGDADLHRRR